MRAIIMAGGKGTRLRPFTTLIPKPLVPIKGEKAILETVLIQLSSQGFTHVTVAVNHYAHLIRTYFSDGSKFGISIDYSEETAELGTFGPLKLIQNLPEDFLVMNGDILTDLNFMEFLRKHIKANSLFTISSFARTEKIDFGVLESSRGKLTGFQEKPLLELEVSMGVYAVNRQILGHIPDNQFFGFDDLMRKLLKLNKPVSTQLHMGKWLDVGRPDDYEIAVSKGLEF